MNHYTNQKCSDLLLHYLPPKTREEMGLRVVMDLFYQKRPSIPDSRLGYLQDIISESRQDGTSFILCDVQIDSPGGALHPVTGDVMGHSVALKIDLENRRIIYQDPKGYGLPPILRQDLQEALPSYEIRELKVQQQGEYNTTDCGPITVENIRRLATSDEVAPYMDMDAVRKQHTADLAARDVGNKK